MRYALCFLFVCLILLPWVATSHDYYPISDGNWWILKEVNAENPRTRIIKIEAASDRKDFYILSRQTEDEADTFTIREGKSGIELTESHVNTFFGEVDFVYDPPATFFPESLSPGIEWSVFGQTSLAGLKIESESRAVVEGTDHVETPAGIFANCLRIKQDYFINTLKISTTFMWLAPEAGIVKEKGSSDEFLLSDYSLPNKEVSVRLDDRTTMIWASIK